MKRLGQKSRGGKNDYGGVRDEQLIERNSVVTFRD